MRTNRFGLAVALVGLAGWVAGHSASASLVVAPNANTSTSGNSTQFGILDSGAATFQVAYDASQFAGIPVGTQITGIGVRLAAGNPTLNTPLNYSSYTIQLGPSANPITSLSSTFAANEGAGTTTVRSGSLTIPAGSLVGGPGPNPFYEFVFSTPFTRYQPRHSQ
jgi:hypothetical protein